MVLASLSSTEGKVFPTVMGVPSNLKLCPFSDTEVPGSTENSSTGMLVWVVAQPISKLRNITIIKKGSFFVFILVSPHFSFIRNLLGCDDERTEMDRGISSTKLHIRICWTQDCGPLKRLPPTQTKSTPGCQSKTPVAQMHFASELPLSRGSHNINGHKITIQENSG